MCYWNNKLDWADQFYNPFPQQTSFTTLFHNRQVLQPLSTTDQFYNPFPQKTGFTTTATAITTTTATATTTNTTNNNNQIYIAPYSRNFRGAGWSQINEDTVKPSLTAQDINPTACVP